MSEASEVKAFKEKLDKKYGKIAKRRLNRLNKALGLKVNLMDMSDKDFDKFVNQLAIVVSQNQQRRNQQQKGAAD